MREIARLYGEPGDYVDPPVDGCIQAGHRSLIRGQAKQALQYYESGVQLHPYRPDMWHNLCAAFTSANSNSHTAALVAAARAAALDPNNANVVRNYGSVLHRVGRCVEAREMLNRANVLQPNSYLTWFDLALLDFAVGRFMSASRCYEKALAYAPAHGPHRQIIEFYSAYPKLALGDYDEGLKLYDGRFIEITKSQAWEMGIPLWDGEDLKGKHLLWHHDQGDGDTLQFCRWLPDVARQGTRVTAAVPRRLMRLMQQLPGIEVIDIDSDLPKADYHSPGTTYMRFLGRKFPCWDRDRPYFYGSLSGHLNIRLPETIPMKIGINWAARNTEYGRIHKTIPLDLMLPLAEDPRVNLYSVQVANTDIERVGAGPLVYNFAHVIRDWQDTADLMSEMDLIVSCDSAPAHLGAAMGKPTICVVPFRGCWRWGSKTAETTPWYPTMTLVRQTDPNDWEEPMVRVRKLVGEMLEKMPAKEWRR